MKNNPKLSIITVVYNAKEELEKTIKSVVQCNYDTIEYIVIDGGSTDGTLDVIKAYEKDINYWVSEPDNGIYDAMNKGMHVATGEWINFINAGDMVLFIDSYALKTLQTTHSSYYYNEEKNMLQRDPFTKLYLTHNTPCHQSIFYKKEEIIPYNIALKIIADFDQMSKICSCVYQPVYANHIVFFATAGVSYASNNDKSWNALITKVKLIQSNMSLGWAGLSFLHTLRIYVRSKLKTFMAHS